jgi:hypothetical protein
MFGNAQSRDGVREGIAKHGVAPGGRKMIDMEEEAALIAIKNGENDMKFAICK